MQVSVHVRMFSLCIHVRVLVLSSWVIPASLLVHTIQLGSGTVCAMTNAAMKTEAPVMAEVEVEATRVGRAPHHGLRMLAMIRATWEGSASTDIRKMLLQQPLWQSHTLTASSSRMLVIPTPLRMRTTLRQTQSLQPTCLNLLLPYLPLLLTGNSTPLIRTGLLPTMQPTSSLCSMLSLQCRPHSHPSPSTMPLLPHPLPLLDSELCSPYYSAQLDIIIITTLF